jgi:hypothetical protein
MKVLDLQCARGHGFEGWFASEEDFQRQTGNGLLTCPLCGEARITRLLSAPRLNLRSESDLDDHNNDVSESVNPTLNDSVQQSTMIGTGPSAVAGMPAALQAAWLHMVRHVLAHTENVGERFAEEARRIYYGETPQRDIRGQSSPAETKALLAEGIAVFPLPIPEGMDGPLQ